MVCLRQNERGPSAIWIVLLAFYAQAAAELEDDGVADQVADMLFDDLFDRAIEATPRPREDLDGTALGKSGHLALPTSGIATKVAPSAAAHLAPRFALERRVEPVRALNHRAHGFDAVEAASSYPSTAAGALAQCRASRHNKLHGRRPSVTAQATATEEVEAVDKVVRDDMRNIAIVAHVDHGKTTLVDAMLTAVRGTDIGKDDRLMDNNDQEKERGITILAKNAAITYKDTKINIVDTPGHADFGGEVERVLGMVDGVLLLVDASEGPKPQTRFVLKKAISMGHKILVVVNKIDKPSSRPDYVVDKTFDLFCELGASDEQTDFPIVYASAINRVAADEPGGEMKNMDPLFDKILGLPKPACDPAGPLQLQISNIAADNFIGRLGIGRIRSGALARAGVVGLSAGPGTPVTQVKVGEIFNFEEMGRNAIEEAKAGEIVMFSGVSDFNIGDTLVALD